MHMSRNAASLSRCWRLWCMAMLLLGAGFAHAQADEGQGDAADPPARVARLSYASGDLGVMPAGSTAWSAADLNRPLTNGDELSSGPGARAELELGGASLRLAGESDVGVLDLDAQIGQFELTQGTVGMTVRSLDAGSTYEIDTPTLALVISQPGTFRVDVARDGSSTTVTVLSGNAIVYGENNAQREVFSGRSYRFNDASLNTMMVSDIEGRDAFDAWCGERDAYYADTARAQYVPADVVGAQDLEQYGNWQVDGDYGPVWYPVNVIAGWAPYRFGHWVWISPWGWTWVDASPWGFAPYHYGRWIFVRGRWGWIPCPPHVRPIYAPALVVFVSTGPSGPVGWFPLGAHEIYNPWYRASRRYYTNVNLTNIAVGHRYNRDIVVNNINHQYNFYRDRRPVTGVAYANRHLPHAFTAVPRETFISARNVQRSRIRLSPQQMANTPVASQGLPQRPSSGSFGRPRSTSARPLPAGGFNRPVVATRLPAVIRANHYRAATPPSRVRVLNVGPHPATRAVSGQGAARFPPQSAPRPQWPLSAPPRPATPTLPQVPRFERAQPIHPVQQAPRYTPPQSPTNPRPAEKERLRQKPTDQQRFNFNTVQRPQDYRPPQTPRFYAPSSRPLPPHPAYPPYRYERPQQPYVRPPMAHPEPQAPHAQPVSRPAGHPPSTSEKDNQH